MLYGADLAKREIAQRRQAVIVEGYTDVMACHLAGVPTAVATSGTSFGDGHIKILRRLLMDADWQVARSSSPSTATRPGSGRRCARSGWRSSSSRRPTWPCSRTGWTRATCGSSRATRPSATWSRGACRSSSSPCAPSWPSTTWTPTRAGWPRWTRWRPIVGRIKDRGLRERYAVSLDRWLGLLDEEFVLARIREHAGADEPGRRRAGQPGGPPRGPGGAGSGPAPRPAAVPPRRAPRHTVTTPAIRWSGWSARCSSWPCSARPCAGRPSTPWRAGTSPCPCTGRCGS